jgi:hypothetical protein
VLLNERHTSRPCSSFCLRFRNDQTVHQISMKISSDDNIVLKGVNAFIAVISKFLG